MRVSSQLNQRQYQHNNSNHSNNNNQFNRQSQYGQQQYVQVNKINFYYTLQHYRPICGSLQTQQQLQYQDHQQIQYQDHHQIQQQDHQVQQHYHVFLINNGWWKSLICILLLNAAFILIYLKFVLDDRLTYTYTTDSQQHQQVVKTYQHSSNYTIMSYLIIISLSLINLSYLLTQFLNPGVRNLQQIPHKQLSNAQKISFCDKCQHYRTQKFTHCSQCQICIWNYDHHCGFFSKCIGGKSQLYAFYLFLASVTAGFLLLLGCMCIQMGQM